jgi:hypothetical protein
MARMIPLPFPDHQVGDFLILLREPFLSVDHQEDHIGFFDGLDGPIDGVVLHIFVDLLFSGGYPQYPAPGWFSFEGEIPLDHIPGGTGDFGNNAVLAFGQAVAEGGLPGIRLP